MTLFPRVTYVGKEVALLPTTALFDKPTALPESLLPPCLIATGARAAPGMGDNPLRNRCKARPIKGMSFLVVPVRIAMKLRLWLAFTAAWFVPLLRADKVDDVVAAQMSKRHIPGLSLAVIEGGVIVRTQGYGVTGEKGSKPVDVDTLFLAGSISKSVTALGALRLVENGKLSLDSDINGSLKTWHLPENEFTKNKKVTLRLILSHSAGITVQGFEGYVAGGPVPTLVQVLDGLKPANSKAIRVDTIPGTQWRYSGGGYTIAQQAIIDVAGEAFPEFMQHNVLRPLEMSASTFAQPLPKELEPKAATGFSAIDEPVPGKWHIYPEMAVAGLWTTPSDLARYVIGVQQSYQGRSNPVISQQMTQEMLKEQMRSDGLGVFLLGKGATRRFGHNGRDEGFDAFMIGYVERGQGAVIMMNTVDDSPAVARITDAIADTYGWPDYDRWRPPAPIEDKDPTLSAQIRTLFDKTRTGDVDPAMVTPELAARIPANHAKELAKHLPVLGPVKSMALVWQGNDNKARLYSYFAECANDSVVATFKV